MMIRSPRFVTSPLLAALMAVSAAPVSGCYVEPAGPPPAPPQMVESAPPAPPAPPQQEIIVENPPEPPPPPPLEPAPPAPPSPGNVWVAGNYRWDNGHYAWQQGHYERPPRPNARHVAGHWEVRAHGRAWVEPRWE